LDFYPQPGVGGLRGVGSFRYHSHMRSSCREDIVARLDALHEVVSDLLELSFDALTTPERLGLLERLEHETRRLPVAGSALINQLRRQAGETELGGKLAHALANRLRILPWRLVAHSASSARTRSKRGQ
jgi:Domain of unknown function (DUF222)